MSELKRRSFLTAGAVAAAAVASPSAAQAEKKSTIVEPPTGKRILLSCKLGMIAKKGPDGKDLTLTERLKLAGDADFDGVDFDEAGSFTAEQARDAVRESGVFAHNAINHAHWGQRLTSAKQEEREQGRKNIEH